MSENKTTRYFKYAIGEIVLVVIGILIALQINNWNENRKANIKAEKYKNTIVNDLKLDTIAINSLIETTKIYKKNISNYFSFIDSLQPSNSNLKRLLDSINNVEFYYYKYYPVNNSFKQMEATGNRDLLTKKQRDFLLNLLSEQEELGIIINNTLQNAIKNKEKSDELSGIPNNLYQKLNANNSQENQIQSLIHLNLRLKNIDDLYYYIDVRGKKIKNMIREHLDLFNNEL